MSPLEPDVPPAGEELHLPGGSVQPILLALGVTLALVGLTSFWQVSVIGSVLSLWVVVRWIRDTRREVDEMPLEHH